MNINNINAEAVKPESSSAEVPIPQVISGDKIKMLRPQDVQKTDETTQDKTRDKPLSAKETKQITEDLNEYMSNLQTNLRFSMYEKLDHQVVVQIKNRETDELIKQIPSEELLELRVKMEELSGLLFDVKI